jgi:hypothetical protein
VCDFPRPFFLLLLLRDFSMAENPAVSEGEKCPEIGL